MGPQEAKPHGWKTIAEHLGCSVSTAQRVEKEDGLPVRRGRARGAHAYESDLEAWLKASDQAEIATLQNGRSARDRR